MNTQATLGSLNLFTLIAVLVIAIGIALWFFRKPKNRHPMGDEGMSDQIHRASESAETTRRARDSR